MRVNIETRPAVRSRALGTGLAAGIGLVFSAVSVGWEKLDPRNIGWLTFGDQQQHWLGWQFFVNDSWRWPLGANPQYGWERMNSIVFTDSFPGLAVLFKALGIDVVDKGQFFGIGFLLGAIALFVGAYRVFDRLGFDLWSALLAAALLGTTPVFWWMQRWYPALSSGVGLLVWALYLYLDDDRAPPRVGWRWLVLLFLAIVTQAYLVIAVIAFFVATLLRRFPRNKAEALQLLAVLVGVSVFCAFIMYVFGYYTVPSKWAQTGGYGWYSANLLGLFNPNGASILIPDLPSISGQYEPTALGLGSLLLLASLGIQCLRIRTSFGLRSIASAHRALALILVMLVLLAITNTISLGSWSFRVPLPHRLEHGLSIFRSSARFMWPALIVVIATAILLVRRHVRRATALLVVALVVQIADSSHELRSVSQRANGTSIDIDVDRDFWQRVPSDYVVITTHPAASLGFDWAQCSYAAVTSGRVGQCGYFSRVQGLEDVNRSQSNALFSGQLDSSAVYWMSIGWLESHREALLPVYGETLDDVQVVRGIRGLSDEAVLVFSNCRSHDSCRFLGTNTQTLGRFLREL
jgi:hypothetical protein